MLIDMSMDMRIIMCMNIYITQANEERLRKLSDKTMSGLINDLLADYFGSKTEVIKTSEDAKKVVAALPQPEKKGKVCAHGQLKGNCLVKGCPNNTKF